MVRLNLWMRKGVGVNYFLYGSDLFAVREPFKKGQLGLDQLYQFIIFGILKLSK